MFNKIKELFISIPNPVKVREFEHSQLGRLVLNDEVGWWEVKVSQGGETVEFGIGGGEAPNELLIKHAGDILNDYPRFKTMIADFLKSEERNFKGFEQEIRRLAIEEICLCWPERPNDGMVYFFNPENEFRLWRCDYKDRKPVGLGFDD